MMTKTSETKSMAELSSDATNEVTEKLTEDSVKTKKKTFVLPGWDPEVKVYLPEELEKDELLGFPAFEIWQKKLKHSLELQKQEHHTCHPRPFRLKEIHVQSADWFQWKTKLGFVKLQALIATDLPNEHGRLDWIPGAVFLRGGSVCMMIILQPDDVPKDSDDEKYVILTVQPRVAAGSLAFAELPAGMLDSSNNVSGQAVQEIKEETGLDIDAKELINMSEIAASRASTQLWKSSTKSSTKGDGISRTAQPSECEGLKEELQTAMFPSPGGCDESISLFVCHKRIPRKGYEVEVPSEDGKTTTKRTLDGLDTLTGKLTGLREEGERITLKLVPLKDLWFEGSRDGKALASLALYNELRRVGKIPS